MAECVGHLPPTLKVWSAAGPRPAVAQVLQLLQDHSGTFSAVVAQWYSGGTVAQLAQLGTVVAQAANTFRSRALSAVHPRQVADPQTPLCKHGLI